MTALEPATTAALREVLGEQAAVSNPVTVAGAATADAYEHAVGLYFPHPQVDAVLVSFLHPLAAPPASVARPSACR